MIRPCTLRVSGTSATLSMDVSAGKPIGEVLGHGRKLGDAVSGISGILHSTLDRTEVIQRIVDEGVAALGSDTGAISERVAGGWVARYLHGVPEELLGYRFEDETERHALLAIQTGDVVPVEDAFNDAR